MNSVDTLFAELSQLCRDQRHPPVHLWHPQYQGSIDIRIDSTGQWFHEGGRIERPELVKLFSGILRKDPDGYCLVTPAEKLHIEVEDAPFIAVDATAGVGDAGEELIFTTNVDDYVIADADHPIWIEDAQTRPRPYVMVRNGLAALISRPLFYRLINNCEEDAEGLFLTSRGVRFPVG